MDKVKEKSPNLPPEEIFQIARPDGIKIWEEKIKQACSNKLKSGYNLIILDKVMNSKKFLTSFFRKYPCKNFKKKLYAIFPEDTGYFTFGNKKTVPFSASLILNICHRIIFRNDHDTVVGPPENRLFLALSFILLYKNVKDILKAKVKDAKFDKCYRVSFHQEIEGAEIPEEFLDSLSQAMCGIKPFSFGEQKCKELAKMFLDKEKVDKLKPIINFAKSEDQLNSAKAIVSTFGL